MKDTLLTILRSKKSTLQEYRWATDQLGTLLASESVDYFPKSKVKVETPLGIADGSVISNSIMLVPILRSGIVLLPPFLKFYPNATIGFIGARRDEETAEAHLYYSKIPPISKNDTILLLDPMLATGGSSILAVETLKNAGADESQIIMISFLASPEGLDHLKSTYPKVKMFIAKIDKGLDSQMRIVPGLGDFGDRYFGTLEE